MYNKGDLITEFKKGDSWSGCFYKIFLKGSDRKKYIKLICETFRKDDGIHPYLRWGFMPFGDFLNNPGFPLDDCLEFDLMYQLDKRYDITNRQAFYFKTPEDSLDYVNTMIQEEGNEEGVECLRLIDVTSETSPGFYYSY